MSALLWVLCSAAFAALTGAMVYIVMRSRTQVLLASEREAVAEARAVLEAQKAALEDSLRNAEDKARRQAMDDFLADIRIEERHYTREHKLLFMTRKSIVRQERIFFRNIPLSNWIEQEMPVEEGADAEALAKTMSVFATEALPGIGPIPVRRFIL